MELSFDDGLVTVPLNDRNKAQIMGIIDFITGNQIDRELGSDIQDIFAGLAADPVFTIRLVEINPNSPDFLLWPAHVRGRPHIRPQDLNVPAPIRNRQRHSGSMYMESLRPEFMETISWRHYGIMSTNNLDKVPCLYRALETAGMDMKRLDVVKTIIVHPRVSQQSLHQIALKTKCIISLNKTANNYGKSTKVKREHNEYYPKINGKRAKSYKKLKEMYPTWPTYKIALANSHYFAVDKKTGITEAALKAIPTDWYDNDTVVYNRTLLDGWYPMMHTHRNKPKPCSSVTLFKYLQMDHIRHFFLEEVTVTQETMNHILFKRIHKEYLSLDYDVDRDSTPYGVKKEKDSKKKHYMHKEMEGEEKIVPKYNPTFVFDFECTTDGAHHEAFGVAWSYVPSIRDMDQKKDTGLEWDTKIYRAEGRDCGLKLMEFLADYYDPKIHKKIVLIAHHAGYDKNFIFKYFNHGELSLLESGNSLKSMTGSFMPYKFGHKKHAVPINVIDSNSFWGCKLSDTVKMFKLDKKQFDKELVPYNLFTKAVMFTPNGELRRYVRMEDFIAGIRKQEGGDGKLRKLLYACNHKMFGLGGNTKYIDEETQKAIDHGLENVKRWDCLIENSVIKEEPYIDFLEYVMRYCEQDVLLLREAWTAFTKMIYYELPSDTNDGDLKIDLADSGYGSPYVSINQLANKYLQMRGCFEGCYEFSGVPRDFMQRFVNGGRCMLANNEKQYITDRKIGDFDACSLYPSAMRLGNGFVAGLPKVLNHNHNVKEIDPSWTHFMFMVKIHSFGKRYPFPIMSYRNEEGGRVYSDGADILEKELPLDYHTWRDCMEHYPNFKFTIINGYYWTTPQNTKICSVIHEIYTRRRKYKQENNPFQAVLKMFMNSAYGRTILKPIDKETRFLVNPAIKRSEEEQLKMAAKNDKFYQDNFYRILRLYRLPEGSRYLYRVEVLKDINEHFSAPHIGSDILSMSKRIMNRVMCTAHDIGIGIYYTDTDSMQIEHDKLPLLTAEYKKKYGRELIGKDMGQFHNDFSFDTMGAQAIHDRYGTGLKIDKEKVHASCFIGVGKKAYYNDLIVKPEETDSKTAKQGAPIVPRDAKSFHIRLKGVNVGSIYHYAATNRMNIKQIYQRLFYGHPLIFDLTAGKACFKQSKAVTVRTLGSFVRKVEFPAEVPKLGNKRALERVMHGCPKLAKYI